MTTLDIAKRFQLQVDDSSQLSTQETLELANEVYEEIQNNRPWEWLRQTFTGVTSTSVNYITLPSDFRMVTLNSDNKSVVFVGDDYSEYILIPYHQRRNHIDEDGYCYIDIPNKKLIFTLQPTESKTVEFDYFGIAPALIYASSPLFPERFHKIISYGMAAKFSPIEHTEKNLSYQRENQAHFEKMLSDMAEEDALIKLNIS